VNYVGIRFKDVIVIVKTDGKLQVVILYIEDYDGDNYPINYAGDGSINESYMKALISSYFHEPFVLKKGDTSLNFQDDEQRIFFLAQATKDLFYYPVWSDDERRYVDYQMKFFRFFDVVLEDPKQQAPKSGLLTAERLKQIELLMEKERENMMKGISTETKQPISLQEESEADPDIESNESY